MRGVLATRQYIRALGVRVSIDDFRTGYSSLSSLRRFPFDKIKIDQSFIRDLHVGDDCTAIVRAMLGLGRSFGMAVITEGVDTWEQLAFLEQESCQQVQGCQFSRPKPIACGSAHAA